MNKTVRLDNLMDFKVAGVYEDISRNTSFYDTKCLLAWDKYLTTDEWLKKSTNSVGKPFLAVLYAIK